MANTSFDDFVKRQTEEAEGREINWNARLLEWLGYLGQFYELVRNHLQQYIDDGKIKLDYEKKRIYEEQLGSYEADCLIVSIGRNQIRFEPIGTLIFGARGRVDMIGPNGETKFVLVPKGSTSPRINVSIRDEGEEKEEFLEEPVTEWEWRIATSPPKVSFLPVDQDSLFDSIMEVSNG